MASLEEIVAALREARAKKQAEIDEIDRALDVFEKVVDQLGPGAKEVFEEIIKSKFSNAIIDDAIGTITQPRRARGPISPEAIAKAVREILLTLKRPMKRGELVAELTARHVPITGGDKNKNLGTILWRHKNQFVHIEKLGYWLRDVPLEGVYTPDE
jgi:malonyl CoA-acyl carrier protein transacylase